MDCQSCRVSIVIPTHRRPREMQDLLYSILNQTLLPMEVIVVEDFEDFETLHLVNRMRGVFLGKGVILDYVKSKNGTSLTVARNIGVNHASGDGILFLDDDIVLESDFIEEILKVYETYPNAIGVSGNIWSTSAKNRNLRTELANAISRIFFLFHHQRDRFTVLPSGHGAVPIPSTSVFCCQRLSGANMMYKSSIFDPLKFDEKLMKWAWLEDVDFSYRVNKKFANSLYMTPFARAVHKWARTSRLPKKSEIYMMNVYETYFFFKNIDKTLLNVMIFVWSRFGKIVIETLELIAKSDRRSRACILSDRLSAYLYILRFLKNIRKGDLDFFTKDLNALGKRGF